MCDVCRCDVLCFARDCRTRGWGARRRMLRQLHEHAQPPTSLRSESSALGLPPPPPSAVDSNPSGLSHHSDGLFRADSSAARQVGAGSFIVRPVKGMGKAALPPRPAPNSKVARATMSVGLACKGFAQAQERPDGSSDKNADDMPSATSAPGAMQPSVNGDSFSLPAGGHSDGSSSLPRAAPGGSGPMGLDGLGQHPLSPTSRSLSLRAAPLQRPQAALRLAITRHGYSFVGAQGGTHGDRGRSTSLASLGFNPGGTMSLRSPVDGSLHESMQADCIDGIMPGPPAGDGRSGEGLDPGMTPNTLH